MTTLDPRGLGAAARASHPQFRYWLPKDEAEVSSQEVAEAAVTAYFAVTQPVVKTVQALKDLPVGTLVFDSHQEELVNLPEGWYCVAHNEMALPHEDIALPARVIWRPHESA